MTKTREERIAEWLGMYISGCWFRTKDAILCQNYRLKEWLASPEGEVAMERAVRAMGYYLISWADEKCEEEPWASVTIKTGYSDDNKKYDGTGKDHNSALQEAILQMLREENNNAIHNANQCKLKRSKFSHDRNGINL
jgi:hypothetical protein